MGSSGCHITLCCQSGGYGHNEPIALEGGIGTPDPQLAFKALVKFV